MTQAFNLSLFANKLNSSGQTDNTGLQNSSVTVTAGTGMSGGGSVALGSSVTLTNAGVTSIVAGSGISISGATGAVTVTNNSVYVGSKGQVFTSSGTFTIPTGVTALKVTVIGGGGGGGGSGYNSGNTGGTSSVASGTQSISTISATGGGGGYNGGTIGGYGAGGSLNAYGDAGGSVNGGGSHLGGGGSTQLGYSGGNAYGGGGTGATGPQGGGGGCAISYLTGLTPSATLSVTIGAGGSPNGGSASYGAAGVVFFEW